MKTKICTKCKQEKSLDKFPNRGVNRKGLRAWCKSCKNKEACKYRIKAKEQNPEQYFKTNFKNNIKSKYGLTVERWQQMFDKQQGCCAVCGIHQSVLSHRLCVEHNHQTGRVRRLTCKTCNHLIDIYETAFYGLKDNIVDYVERNNA